MSDSVRQILFGAASRLRDAGCETPRLDAELLLMHAWGMSRTELIMRLPDEPPADIIETFRQLIERRQKREPVAYITGEKEFWSRSFHVTPDVLIPRPETEHLIEAVERFYPDRNAPYLFCDIGTGSGCIACTLACEYPGASIIATDISANALDIARLNAQRHGVSDRIQFLQGDMFAALESEVLRFDAILSNPPYVAAAEMDSLEDELAYEPGGALTDGKDGLTLLANLFQGCHRWLRPGGRLIVETGLCGFPDLPENLKQEECYTDLAGHVRGGVFRL